MAKWLRGFGEGRAEATDSVALLVWGGLTGRCPDPLYGWPDLYRILNQERKAEKNESEDFLAVWILTCPGPLSYSANRWPDTRRRLSRPLASEEEFHWTQR